MSLFYCLHSKLGSFTDRESVARIECTKRWKVLHRNYLGLSLRGRWGWVFSRRSFSRLKTGMTSYKSKGQWSSVENESKIVPPDVKQSGWGIGKFGMYLTGEGKIDVFYKN